MKGARGGVDSDASGKVAYSAELLPSLQVGGVSHGCPAGVLGFDRLYEEMPVSAMSLTSERDVSSTLLM